MVKVFADRRNGRLLTSRAKKKLLALTVSVLAVGCSYEPLQPTSDGPPQHDDLAGAATIAGVQVLPATIHPGDRVTLRDPLQPDDSAPIPLYYWDACVGSVEQDVPYSRQATWIAPSQPGTYSVTMNVTNTAWNEPSRVLRLCVAPDGQETCAADTAPAPVLSELAALPDFLNEGKDCDGNCVTQLSATVSSPGAEPVQFRWAVRKGQTLGGGAEVEWRLPVVGCCTEVFAAALTSCDANGGAVTGAIDVTVEPE